MLPARDADIVVVDQDDQHVYQPGLLFVPFGLADPDEITRPRHRQLHAGIGFRRAAVERVDLGREAVLLDDGTALRYDALVIVTGARLVPEETEGLDAGAWPEGVRTFYTPAGAVSPRDILARFDGGRTAVDVIDMPIKCPHSGPFRGASTSLHHNHLPLSGCRPFGHRPQCPWSQEAWSVGPNRPATQLSCRRHRGQQASLAGKD